MTEKKVIPVKYFYYGMLVCVFFICGVFFFVWQREAKEDELLEKNGVKTEAWVTNLYQSKASKKSSPVYYMEVAFFKDTLSHEMPKKSEPVNNNPKTGDEIVAAMARQTESLSEPLGDYEKQTITLPSFYIFKNYALNDRVKIIYLKDDPSIVRIATEP